MSGLALAIDPGYRPPMQRACEVDRPPCPEPGACWVEVRRPNGVTETRWVCRPHALFIEAAQAKPPEVKVPAHPPLVVDPIAPAGRCRIAGCDRPVKARGLCNVAYDTARNDGRLNEVGLPAKSPSEAGKLRHTPVTKGPPPPEPPLAALPSPLEADLRRELAEANETIAKLRSVLSEIERERERERLEIRQAPALSEADLRRRLALLQASDEAHAEADRRRAEAEAMRAEALRLS